MYVNTAASGANALNHRPSWGSQWTSGGYRRDNAASENDIGLPAARRFYGSFRAAADVGSGDASASAIVAQLVPAAETH